MAELEDAPWAVKKKDAISVHPVDTALPDAPWAAPAPSVGEDVAKSLVTGGVEGVIGLPGVGGDLQQLAKAGSEKLTEKGLNPFSWLGDKFGETQLGQFLKKESAKTAKGPIASVASGDLPGSYELPTSAGIQKTVEENTGGKFYESKTPYGKAARVVGQVAPALAAGGESLPGTITKAVGAGVGSELGSQSGEAIKGHLPDSIAPWAEPVGKIGGTVAGLFGPAGLRRAVTPLPMEAEQAAAVAALKTKDPNFPMTAGQMTNSPSIMSLEGRAPKFSDMPAKQEEAFTRGTMKEMGVDGLATPENVAKGQDIGKRIGDIRRTNEINTAEFPQLNKDITQVVRQYTGTVGVANAKPLVELQNEIRLGAGNSPNVASMQGKRYNYMRQKVQSAIDNASTGDEKTALGKIREKLDEAFHRSIPTDQSAELKKLETQYANYNVLANRRPPAPSSGAARDIVSPDEVSKAVAKNFGNAAVNENKGTLAPWSRNASKVMQELPKANPEGVGNPASRVGGSILGGILGGGAGYAHGGVGPAISEGIVGAIAGGGHGGLPDVVQVLKNIAGRGMGTGPAQAYLKNQGWLPGPASSAEAATIARLLASPTLRPLVPDQTK